VQFWLTPTATTEELAFSTLCDISLRAFTFFRGVFGPLFFYLNISKRFKP
jgi:hypothetical protein